MADFPIIFMLLSFLKSKRKVFWNKWSLKGNHDSIDTRLNKNPPRGIFFPLWASYWHLLETPFHGFLEEGFGHVVRLFLQEVKEGTLPPNRPSMVIFVSKSTKIVKRKGNL